MPWKTIASPLAVIIIGVLITIVALATPGSGSGANPSLDPYPTMTAAMQTAERELTLTHAAAYPPDSDDPMATPTATTTAVTTTETAATPSQATATVPPSARDQPTQPAGPGPLPPTETAPEETTPQTPGPEGTPTTVDALVCTPGEPITIDGEGPPRAAFLLYFGERVVSGGSVGPSGYFAIPLVVGQERPGTYLVTVRVRGSTQVLRELTCEVPPVAPPTPVKGRPD